MDPRMNMFEGDAANIILALEADAMRGVTNNDTTAGEGVNTKTDVSNNVDNSISAKGASNKKRKAKSPSSPSKSKAKSKATTTNKDTKSNNKPDKPTWNDFFFSYSLFRAMNAPDAQPDKEKKDAVWGQISEADLSKWMRKQNADRKKQNNLVSEEQIKVLDKVGFPWVRGDRGRWEDNFNKLVQYRELHGHCNVNKSDENKPLAHWVRNQRFAYKHLSLASESVDKLNGIGFQWTMRQDSKEVWNEKFTLMQEYVAENGHSNVPRRHEALGRWVSEQRSLYKKKMDGKKSSSSWGDDHIQKLESIGFSWTGSAANKSPGKKKEKGKSPKKIIHNV